jgi:hypothetical protein
MKHTWASHITMLLVLVGLSGPGKAMAANEVLDLSLGNLRTEEFIDFLYDFSQEHRLSVDWFGWYTVDNPSEWYERPPSHSDNYKITLYLMSVEAGYIVFTNGFDERQVKAAINHGEAPKREWRVIMDKLREELDTKGLISPK